MTKKKAPKVKDHKGECPCGRSEECPLARMVRNNRKILMALTGVKEAEDR